jgi:hypothetical protein
MYDNGITITLLAIFQILQNKFQINPLRHRKVTPLLATVTTKKSAEMPSWLRLHLY